MCRILCIETGTEVCSVALAVDGEVVSLRESDEGRNHGTDLALFIDEIFRENQVSADMLDAVAVSTGPGSYTGLRIGISLAKGICYAENLPLISVNSLDSLVQCAAEDIEAGIVDAEPDADTLLVPMIDARRMEVYTRVYDSGLNPLSAVEAKIIDADSFGEWSGKKLVIFGNGAGKCVDVLPAVSYIHVVPSARGIVKSAFQKLESKSFEDLAYFEPFYLKNFIGTKSCKNSLGI